MQSKVRKNKKVGKSVVVCDSIISCGEWIPGLFRERLILFSRAFRGPYLSSLKTKG